MSLFLKSINNAWGLLKKKKKNNTTGGEQEEID
jgi:hypothetical protein